MFAFQAYIVKAQTSTSINIYKVLSTQRKLSKNCKLILSPFEKYTINQTSHSRKNGLYKRFNQSVCIR